MRAPPKPPMTPTVAAKTGIHRSDTFTTISSLMAVSSFVLPQTSVKQMKAEWRAAQAAARKQRVALRRRRAEFEAGVR
jgi:hypothetical protein